MAVYHRLNVFNIPLPSLRERREDIPALVEYFLGPLGTDQSRPRIAQRAMHCLLSYEWPGNVRELQNVLERGMILSELFFRFYLPPWSEKVAILKVVIENWRKNTIRLDQAAVLAIDYRHPRR